MRGIVALLLVSACSGGIESGDMAGAGGAGGDPTVDAGAAPIDGHQIDTLDSNMVDRAARMMRYAKINDAAYKSSLGDFNIDVYISDDARDYRAIHPDGPDTNVTFAEGTMIVRKVYDATGAIAKITLMAKGPAGYDSTLGDWWFGVTDPSGIPLADGNGGYQVGRLTECHGCHVPHAGNDFLFGVPAINQPTNPRN